MKHLIIIAFFLRTIIVLNFQAVNGLGALSNLASGNSLTGGKSSTPDRTSPSAKNCEKVKCQNPPADAKCNTVDLNGSKFPRPTGKNAECCPLWKCTRTNESGFFTFHGIASSGSNKDDGGTEIVRYTSTTPDKSQGVPNVVSSVATGRHGASALATDDGSSPNMEDLMAEFSKTFQEHGLKLR